MINKATRGYRQVRLALVLGFASVLHAQADFGWPTYGGDAGGQRYSASDQVTPKNVQDLRIAWTFRTHALERSADGVKLAAFEATPVLHDGVLFLSTPFDQVIALDAQTGQLRWQYDPKLSPHLDAPIFTSRGIAVWAGKVPPALPCTERVFVGTLDARLIALDLRTGQTCDDFGRAGSVDLKQNVPTQQATPYAGFGVTSPPVVVGDTVIVGSAVIDNQDVAVEPGLVRGYNVHTGALRWTWAPLPATSSGLPRVGAGNTWGAMATDLQRGIVYLPTGSLSPDFFGGERLGDNRDANSLVALDAATGRKLWAFQTVHHDLWDYDIAAEPLLFDFHGTPAVAVATKTGMLFVLNRLTGAPLLPVTEYAVPRTDVSGEQTSPTQPLSGVAPLAPLSFTARPAGVGSRAGDLECAARLSALRYNGIFTPPSLQGTLLFPGSLGGVNWGSGAFDPETGVYYANTNRLPFEVRLIPRFTGRIEQIAHDPPWYYGLGSALVLVSAVAWWRLNRRRGYLLLPLAGICVLGTGVVMESHPFIAGGSLAHFGVEISQQHGTPFWVYRAPLVDAQGLPCTAPPWGALTGVDLTGNRKLFEAPVGTLRQGQHTGTVGLGGPAVTKGGLLFNATSREPLLRAFDKRSGAELWQGKLPVPAQATPMIYTLNSREYIVICAGGHGAFGTNTGDTVVAFALQPPPLFPATHNRPKLRPLTGTRLHEPPVTPRQVLLFKQAAPKRSHQVSTETDSLGS